jgi:hypothetical protein
MEVKVGARLRSVVDPTEVVVVRTPGGDIDLRCGGHAMIALADTPPADAVIDPELSGGTAIGKRYSEDELGLELLVTKAGQGSLSLGATVLELKSAKPLPSSD